MPLSTAALRARAALARRAMAIWLPLLLLATVAIGAAAWFFSVDFFPLALAAETRVKEFRTLSLGELLSGDGGSLGDMQTRIDQLELEIRPTARNVDWVARFSPALAWVPALSHEVVAWAAQVDRLHGDVKSAAALLASSSRLLEVYRQGQSVLVSPRTSLSPSDLSAEARELESSFATTFAGLTEIANAGERHRITFRFGAASDAMSLLRDAEERMLAASRIGQQVSGLLAELLEIGDTLQPVLGQLMGDGYEPEPLTVEELRAKLLEIDESLQFALVKSRGLAKQIADAGQSEPLQHRLELLQDVLGVLLIVNRATMVGIRSLEPVLQQAGDPRAGLLGGDEGLVSALRGLADHGEELNEALALVEDAQRTLAELERTEQLPGLEDLVAAANLLGDGLRLVNDIAPIGAALVGADSARRYLVLGQSADELRATGGYVSAVWLVTFQNGGVTDVQYHDVVRVDDWERLELYPPAPSGLEEHMNAQVWLLRDVSWEPDFPTAARTAADMYRIGQRQDVDGVVAINQWTLLALVQGLGSIPSPGGGTPITHRNLFSKLEQGSDEHGRAYMDLAMQGILDRLDQSVSLSTLMKLASALHATLQERDLLLFMDDPEIQATIAERAWDGRVRSDSTDYLYVVDSNVGWSKADRNIERKVGYQVDLRKGPGARVKLTLGYNNHGGPGAPGCEPQWLNRGTNYSQLKNACYWNFWRVYIPQGAKLLGNTPLTLPEYSVSAEIGRGRPGEDTVKVSSSYNRTVISGLFALGAGRATNVDLVYDLPHDVLRRDGNDVYYSLLIQKQPGARNREVSVEIIPPDGHHLSSSSIPPDAISDSRLWYSLELNRDTVLAVRFTGGDDGGR